MQSVKPDPALEDRILAAHAANDLRALVDCYERAAGGLEASGKSDESCFFLTHAYVFALDAGDPRAAELRARLVAQGRETPDP
nr:hypothetical protein [Pseudoruegeria sp. HB172150]